jgi:hypothetical protein
MHAHNKTTVDDGVLEEFEPVLIKTANDAPHEISDVFQAVEWLLKRWPADHVSSPAYSRARTVCISTWEGKTHPVEARAAFLEAAQAAGICCERPASHGSKTAFRAS